MEIRRVPYTGGVPVTIQPLSKIDVSVVREFLTGHQHDQSAINWKYDDRVFNGTGERGFACVDGGKITSFLGLIPFTVMQNGKTLNAAWSCDWYRDEKASGPLGVMLMQQSLKAYPFIYSLGGSEMTKAIMGRLSRITVPNAGVELYKPLRAGGAAYLLQKATGRRHISLFPSLSRLRLPARTPRPPKELKVEILDVLPSALNSLLQQQSNDSHIPAYDLPYLQWLLERCPCVQASVCMVSSKTNSALVGAILLWHPTGDRRFWRLAPLPGEGNQQVLRAGLNAATAHIRDQGGWLASILASHRDTQLLTVAKEHGFFRSPSGRPLYILAANPVAAPQELQTLSYLDTDYAYRFPGTSA